MKRCNGCGQTRPLSDFHRHARARDGHSSTCRICKNASVRRWAERRKTKAPLVRLAGSALSDAYIDQHIGAISIRNLRAEFLSNPPAVQAARRAYAQELRERRPTSYLAAHYEEIYG